MQMNPIVKKDIRVQARSMRICWGVFAYETIMALVFFFALFVIQENAVYTTGNIYSSIVWLYPVLAVTQIIILGVVVPVRTASAISGEKERQTFDIMMTTSMTPFSIIVGKVTTAVIQSLFFVVAGMPILALAFVIGGISWSYLFWFFVIAALVSLFSASIGILCSSLCKRSITAVIMSYGIYAVFFILTAIPYLAAAVIGRTYGIFYRAARGLFLINPVMYLVEFFSWIMGENSVAYELLDVTGIGGFAVEEWMVHDAWMAASSALFFLILFFFLLIASRRISPLSKRKARKLSFLQAGQQIGNKNG